MNNSELKYNFVFMFARTEYWKAILGNELYGSDCVRVYKEAFEGHPFMKILFKIHWSYRINKIIELPFKFIWFKKMYKQNFNNDLPICFVYMGGNSIRYDGGFCKYVRKQSEKNRQVIYHGDLISKKCKYDYSLIRNKVDIATTYDKEESVRYGIHYFREITYSKLIPEPENIDFEQDVYFLGVAKDRMAQIIEVYKYLYGNGIKCKFLIAGVKPEERYEGNGIEYINGISYVANLENVIKSRCILELIQGDSSDITLRTREAIAYRRRLLTNCQLCNEDFFNPGQMQKFINPDTINLDFIKADFNADDYNPQLDMNPMQRLYDIQSALEAEECQNH